MNYPPPKKTKKPHTIKNARRTEVLLRELHENITVVSITKDFTMLETKTWFVCRIIVEFNSDEFNSSTELRRRLNRIVFVWRMKFVQDFGSPESEESR